MSQLIHRTLKQIGRRLSANGIDANIRFSLDPPPVPASTHQAEVSIGDSARCPATTTKSNNTVENGSDIKTISTTVPMMEPDIGDVDESTIQQMKKKKNSEPIISQNRNDQRELSTNLDTSQMIIGSVSKVDESGFKQWHNAMRMVSRLPGGIPADFRQKLWLTMADRNIQRRKIDWPKISRHCFNDQNNPDDEALGIQIVKDLHRTGCSLFSGKELHNQALLKQVLLGYARWNKSVGYCQGFNMLAAIILEVMEGNVNHSLKVMIYLIEDVLPESYFANNLRGLSVDMAVFRDLMRLKLSELARHLDCLQYNSYDPQLGVNYEPPLINVFTMQWFLTLFSNCLPKSSILRIWDLIFLEGNEILLRTALAIWDCLADRILPVKSADEFYSIMGVLTREMMEFGITDTNEMISTICGMAPFPFPQLTELRERYIYNIRPLSLSIFQLKKGFVNMLNSSVQKLIDDDDDDDDSGESNNNNRKTEELVQKWFEDQFVVANWCLNSASRMKSPSKTPSPINGGNNGNSGSNNNIFDTFLRQLQVGTLGNGTGLNLNNLSPGTGSVKSGTEQPRLASQPSLDISMLKKQYLKLKQRQKQAQLILAEGFRYDRPSSGVSSPTNGTSTTGASSSGREPFSMSQLLSGKTALIARKCRKVSLLNQDVPRARFNGTNYQSATANGKPKQATTTTNNNNSSSPSTTGSGSTSPSSSRSHVYQRSNTISSLLVTSSSTTATYPPATITVPKCTKNPPAAPPLTPVNVPTISIVGQQTHYLPPSQPHHPLTYDLLMVQPAQSNNNYYNGNNNNSNGISWIGLNYRRSNMKSSSSSTSTELCDEIIGGGCGSSSIDDIEDEEIDCRELYVQDNQTNDNRCNNNNNNNESNGVIPALRRRTYSKSYDDIRQSLSFEDPDNDEQRLLSPSKVNKDDDCEIDGAATNDHNNNNNNNNNSSHSRKNEDGKYRIRNRLIGHDYEDDDDNDDVFQVSSSISISAKETNEGEEDNEDSHEEEYQSLNSRSEGRLDSESNDSLLDSRIRQFQDKIEQIKIEQSIN